VFGRVAGEQAAGHALAHPVAASSTLLAQAEASMRRHAAPLVGHGGERVASLRDEMTRATDEGIGIFRTEQGLAAACDKLADLRERHARGVHLDDRNRAFNTEWLAAIELGYMLDVAQAMAHAARERRESRGAHMRLDGFEARDDERFLAHSLAHYAGAGTPRIGYAPVTITRSPPRARVYGGAATQAVTLT
jgi:fumarate reductase flavoprotein subunit